MLKYLFSLVMVLLLVGCAGQVVVPLSSVRVALAPQITLPVIATAQATMQATATPPPTPTITPIPALTDKEKCKGEKGYVASLKKALDGTGYVIMEMANGALFIPAGAGEIVVRGVLNRADMKVTDLINFIRRGCESYYTVEEGIEGITIAPKK